jgi:hypothetical protein
MQPDVLLETIPSPSIAWDVVWTHFDRMKHKTQTWTGWRHKRAFVIASATRWRVAHGGPDASFHCVCHFEFSGMCGVVSRAEQVKWLTLSHCSLYVSYFHGKTEGDVNVEVSEAEK